MNKYILNILLLILAGGTSQAQKKFDKQAHRGGTGLMPENTIAAMKNALHFGTTLEMDLYITKDKQVILSHDSHMSATFALNPDGSAVTKEQSKGLGLHNMLYTDIVKYDVGSRLHPSFPQQKKMVARIPLFATLIDSIEAYAKIKHMPAPIYNPEAKIPSGTYTQDYRENAVKEIMDIILQKKIQKRVIIQSFDTEILEILHKKYPRIKTSYLVYVGKNDWIGNLKKLSFKPYAYSPYYKQVNKKMIEYCHRNKIKVVTWTVNEKSDIDNLKEMGVDGIISDYPNLF